MAAVIPPATFVVHCTNAQETLNFLAAEMESQHGQYAAKTLLSYD